MGHSPREFIPIHGKLTSYAHTADYFRVEDEHGWIEFKEHAFTYNGMVVETSRGPLKLNAPNQQAAQMDDFAQCVIENRESRDRED